MVHCFEAFDTVKWRHLLGNFDIAFTCKDSGQDVMNQAKYK